MAKRSTPFFILCLAVGVWSRCPLSAAPGQPVQAPAFTVTLRAEQDEYLLGENVRLHAMIRNVNGRPLIILGDSGLTAVDETGMAVGGLNEPAAMGIVHGGSVTLRPGDQVERIYVLSRSCHIDKPGTYRVRLPQLGRMPVSTEDILIRFKLPSAQQAARILAEIENPPMKAAQRGPIPEYRDITSLDIPIYLPGLVAWARQNQPKAIEGIGSIETPEATEALIELAEVESESGYHVGAAEMLKRRLPGNGYGIDPAIRERVARNCWDPKFGQRVRDLAKRFLAANDRSLQAQGGQMLASIGAPEDAKFLFALMDRELDPMTTATTGWDMGDFPPPLPDALNAVGGLKQRGLVIEQNELGDNGKAFAYFTLYSPSPRSAGWLDLVRRYAASDNVIIRQVAVHSIPVPMAPEYTELVQQASKDPDYGVKRTAQYILTHP